MYRDLVLASLDYYLETGLMKIKTDAYDSDEHFKKLKREAEVHCKKGRLTLLKRWFRDFTEMQVEECDLVFNKYLQVKTGYDIDIFRSYHQRVDRVVEKGRITTDNQFYDITIMVDQLCQIEPVDHGRIELLNRLLSAYEQRKSGLKGKAAS